MNCGHTMKHAGKTYECTMEEHHLGAHAESSEPNAMKWMIVEETTSDYPIDPFQDRIHALEAKNARLTKLVDRQIKTIQMVSDECPDCRGFGDGPIRCSGAGDVIEPNCETCQGTGCVPKHLQAIADRDQARAEANRLHNELDAALHAYHECGIELGSAKRRADNASSNLLDAREDLDQARAWAKRWKACAREFRRSYESEHSDCLHYANKGMRYYATITRLRGVLGKITWFEVTPGSLTCICCGEWKPDHRKSCDLAAALAEGNHDDR